MSQLNAHVDIMQQVGKTLSTLYVHALAPSSASACWLMLSACADASKEDGIVHGATSLLRAQSLFRAVSRQPSALAGLVTALMAGSRYNSPQAQQSILECYLLFALRFIRPPQLAAAQAGSLLPVAGSLNAQRVLTAQYSLLTTLCFAERQAQCWVLGA